MKIVKKILLSLLAIPLVLFAVAVVLQIYYRLTPVALSPEALELNARAAKLPTLTENGYRLFGLLAPREQDAVVYGKCLVDAYEKAAAARSKALDDTCLKGGALLTLPKALTDIRVNLATTEDQWKTLAAVVPDETVLSRVDAVRSDGVRRLGAEVDSPLPIYSSLMNLERWRIARGIVAWRSDDHQQATNLWTNAIADWATSANNNLIEAMLATAAQTQVLIAIQSSVARAGRVEDTTTNGLLTALRPIETMSDSVAESMVAEWQIHANSMQQVALFPTIAFGFAPERNVFARARDGISAWAFDLNGTLNAFARGNLWSQDALRTTARGGTSAEFPVDMASFGCDANGHWGMACLPFMRNPVGQILAAIALPMYSNYGTRVADLRNLAAATRLTIEARRRGLTGVSLAQFVAAAAPDMRDVFTGRPFGYDSARKRLSVELRERSTILGEKGLYELPL